MFWRKRHEVSDEELSALVDGMLAPARAGAVERHALTCAACAATLDELRTLKSLLGALPTETPARSFRLSPAQAEATRGSVMAASPRFPMALAPAAALVLLVAVVGGGASSAPQPAAGGVGAAASEPALDAPVMAAAPPNDGAADSGEAPGAPAAAEEQRSFAAQGEDEAAADDADSRTAWRLAEALAAVALVGSLAYLLLRRRAA